MTGFGVFRRTCCTSCHDFHSSEACGVTCSFCSRLPYDDRRGPKKVFTLGGWEEKRDEDFSGTANTILHYNDLQ